jgi:uncharacterized protein
LITPEHARIFKEYNVKVGVSIDGPADLNSLRVPTNKRLSVDDMTKKTMDALQILSQHEVYAGIILTVHKLNGMPDKLPRLMNFIRWLGDLGHMSGNIHTLEVDSEVAKQYCLTPEENEHAFIQLAEFFDQHTDLFYDPFREMELMMKGNNDTANCIWKSCDSMNTGAVYGIEGNGQLSNCGMVNKEGIEWTKANDTSYVRDLILYQTEHEYGGCKGCPYFVACNGYCPGSSIDGDWRNKTTYCSSLKKMFAYYETKVESQGIVPYSKRPGRERMEEIYINEISSGRPKPTMTQLADMVGAETHG